MGGHQRVSRRYCCGLTTSAAIPEVRRFHALGVARGYVATSACSTGACAIVWLHTALLADPALLLDQGALNDRDLPAGPPKVCKRQPQHAGMGTTIQETVSPRGHTLGGAATTAVTGR